MSKFKNKIVLITGASSGIGAACAKIFAEHGAKLILCARRDEKNKQVAQELQQQYSVEILTLQMDVQQAEKVQDALTNLPPEWRDIDILINNAGLSLGLDKIQTGNIADWEQMIDTNVKGLLYVTGTVLPGMVARNCGHIINIGSISGHEVYAGGVVYCATKFAVHAITAGLKKDLHGTAVRVSTVDPGIVETDFSQVRFKGDTSRAEAVYKGLMPLIPDDIADAVYYCASRPPHVNIREMIILPTAQSSTEMIDRR